MHIAYIILAHKNPAQVIRLINALNNENTSFFIHIDRKSDNAIYDQNAYHFREQKNIHFLNRYKYYWGKFGSIEATLEAIKSIFSKQICADYIILLTGQCYPIKSNSQIEEFLKKNFGTSFMHYFSVPCTKEEEMPDWIGEENLGLDRFRYWHFRLFGKKYIFPKYRKFKSPILSLCWLILIKLFPWRRKFIKGFEMYGGLAYWCLTRECAEYIFEFTQKNKSFVNFFKYVNCPDEIFF